MLEYNESTAGSGMIYIWTSFIIRCDIVLHSSVAHSSPGLDILPESHAGTREGTDGMPGLDHWAKFS